MSEGQRFPINGDAAIERHKSALEYWRQFAASGSWMCAETLRLKLRPNRCRYRRGCWQPIGTLTVPSPTSTTYRLATVTKHVLQTTRGVYGHWGLCLKRITFLKVEGVIGGLLTLMTMGEVIVPLELDQECLMKRKCTIFIFGRAQPQTPCSRGSYVAPLTPQ